MKKISLSGKWRMIGNGYDCYGTIPGSLFSFLLENGLMDNPHYRDNEYTALELTYHDYTFERTFEYDGTGTPILRFEGLDTFCDIYLNGKKVASTDNMHITYEFDVSDSIKAGENTLTVTCRQIHDYIKEKSDELDLF